MNQAQGKEQIFNRFVQVWAAGNPTVTYQLENLPGFVEPDPTSGAYWARVTCVHNRPIQETLGAPGNRRICYSGNLYVQLFGPIGVGSGPMDLLKVSVGAVFSVAQFGPSGDSIYTEPTAMPEGGNEGRWYMSTTITPFRYYNRE